MNRQNVIGPAVRRIRNAQGLSQEALAARCQVLGWSISRAGLSKIEARLRRVNDAELFVLAKVMGVSVGQLIASAGELEEWLAVVRCGDI